MGRWFASAVGCSGSENAELRRSTEIRSARPPISKRNVLFPEANTA